MWLFSTFSQFPTSIFACYVSDGDEIEVVVMKLRRWLKVMRPMHPILYKWGYQMLGSGLLLLKKQVVTCVEDNVRAVTSMMAYYYVFNIACPIYNEWSVCLLFIEEYLFCMKGGPELNLPQVGTISDIGSLAIT